MNSRMLIFDANSLLKLLTHYTMDHDVQIPLDATLLNAGVSTMVGRWIILEVDAPEWDGELPDKTGELPFIHIRFEGSHVMSWKAGSDTTTHDSWKKAVESPK